MRKQKTAVVICILIAGILYASPELVIAQGTVDHGSCASEGKILDPVKKECVPNPCPPGQEPRDPGQSFNAATNPCKIINPAKGQLVDTDNFPQLLSDIIKILLSFAGVIGVIFLILGGYRYIASQGNEEGMEKAKKTIMGALIGIVLIILSFAVVAIINNLLVKGP